MLLLSLQLTQCDSPLPWCCPGAPQFWGSLQEAQRPPCLRGSRGSPQISEGKGVSLGEAQFPRPGKEAAVGFQCLLWVQWIHPTNISSRAQCSIPVPPSAVQEAETECLEFQNTSLFTLRKYNPIGNYFTAEGWLSRHGTFPFTKSMSVFSKPPEIIITALLPPAFFTHKFAIIPSHT